MFRLYDYVTAFCVPSGILCMHAYFERLELVDATFGGPAVSSPSLSRRCNLRARIADSLNAPHDHCSISNVANLALADSMANFPEQFSPRSSSFPVGLESNLIGANLT